MTEQSELFLDVYPLCKCGHAAGIHTADGTCLDWRGEHEPCECIRYRPTEE